MIWTLKCGRAQKSGTGDAPRKAVLETGVCRCVGIMITNPSEHSTGTLEGAVGKMPLIPITRDLTSPGFVYDHSEQRRVSDVCRDVPGGPGWTVVTRSDDRSG